MSDELTTDDSRPRSGWVKLTTFLVGLFNRSWPYTLFAAGLLGLSLFTERPFCKYLCPLGAALAHEQAIIGLVLDSQDAHEGCSAFLEKRKAQFTGK